MNPIQSDHDILTLKDLCDLLHVHPSTVYRLIKKGKIPSFRIGSDWRFRRDQIERWMAEATTGSPQCGTWTVMITRKPYAYA